MIPRVRWRDVAGHRGISARNRWRRVILACVVVILAVAGTAVGLALTQHGHRTDIRPPANLLQADGTTDHAGDTSLVNLVNESNTEVTIAGPITLIDPAGHIIPDTHAELDDPRGVPCPATATSCGGLIPRLTRLAAHATAFLMVRIQCERIPGARNWPLSYVRIAVPITGYRAPLLLPYHQVFTVTKASPC